MELKNYQDRAVSRLLGQSIGLLGKNGTRICAFKAPTGSGKTIMAAELLRRFADSELPSRYAYLWISSNNLHTQSKKKLSDYLGDSEYELLLLEDISDTSLAENQVIFVNWESLTKQDRMTGEFKNIFMRESESGRSLPNLVSNAKKNRARHNSNHR